MGFFPGLTVQLSGSKHNWNIETAWSTRVLLIADSNFRHVSSVPEDWEIHVFPGSRFEHLLDLCKCSLLVRQFEAVYIQAGVNNRRNRNTSNRADADSERPSTKCRCATNLRKSVVFSIFTGSSTNCIGWIQPYSWCHFQRLRSSFASEICCDPWEGSVRDSPWHGDRETSADKRCRIPHRKDYDWS